MQIFVTCTGADRQFAENVASSLRHAGAQVSVSDLSRSLSFRFGFGDAQEWAQETVERRTEYHWLIGVLSPHAFRHANVSNHPDSHVVQEILASFGSPSASIVLIDALPYHEHELDLGHFTNLPRFDATRDYQAALQKLMDHLKLTAPSEQSISRNALVQPSLTSPVASRATIEGRMPEQSAPRDGPIGVFISYSRTDETFVRKLIADLLAYRISVWWDQGRLKLGTPDWDREIRRGLTSSRGVIYVASEDAASSPSVRDELNVARDNHVPVYPLWARGDKWSSCIPLGWGQTQYVDGRGDNYDGALRTLVASLVGTAGA